MGNHFVSITENTVNIVPAFGIVLATHDKELIELFLQKTGTWWHYFPDGSILNMYELARMAEDIPQEIVDFLREYAEGQPPLPPQEIQQYFMNGIMKYPLDESTRETLSFLLENHVTQEEPRTRPISIPRLLGTMLATSAAVTIWYWYTH